MDWSNEALSDIFHWLLILVPKIIDLPYVRELDDLALRVTPRFRDSRAAQWIETVWNWRFHFMRKNLGKGKDQDTAKKANFKDWAVFVIWKPAKYEAAVTPPLTLPLTYS